MPLFGLQRGILMSPSEFSLAVKSTIDKLIYELASSNNYDFFDLDGSYLLPEQAESTKPAIAWGLLNFSERGRDPFYTIHFEVGAKTANDESQYTSMNLLGLIQGAFPVNKSIYVSDYSKESGPSVVSGCMTITSSVSTPPSFDKVSGTRAVQLIAAVQRFI